MQHDAYDHLIIGSSPLAELVAGLLRREHGRTVCLVAEPYSAFGLERRFDLSLDLITRPETLVLLKRLTAETAKLVAGFDKHAIDRVDPLFISETAAGIAALGHFRHLAQALDFAVERVADRDISEGEIVRLRGQNLIAYHRWGPAAKAWLDEGEVQRLDAATATVTLRRDGTAGVLARGGTAIEARQVLLADAAAVINHLPPAAWDPALVKRPATALLLQPSYPAANPFVVWFDRGVAVRQETKGALSAVAVGEPGTAESRVAASSARSLPLRRAGEVRYETLITVDGAPILAQGRGIKANYLAGFGLAAAFYAPAIARQLAGKASADEAAWFAARGATRGNARANVAEVA